MKENKKKKNNVSLVDCKDYSIVYNRSLETEKKILEAR